jgi:hypothetical protein
MDAAERSPLLKSLVCVLKAQIEVPRNSRVMLSATSTSRSIADDLTAARRS